MTKSTSLFKSLVLPLVALFGLAFATLAQANVGTVMEALNGPTVESPTTQLLRKGARVDAGDTIVTGPNARVQLLLDDGTRIAIKQNSRFLIEELEMTADDQGPAIGGGQQLSARFALLKGGFRTETGRISARDPSVYQVRTPSAIIRVRGTNYVARVCDQDCGTETKDGLYVGVSENEISIENDGGRLDLGKNEFGYAADFQTPPEKLLMPPSTLQDEGLEFIEEEEEDESESEEEAGGEEQGEEEGADESSTTVATDESGEALGDESDETTSADAETAADIASTALGDTTEGIPVEGDETEAEEQPEKSLDELSSEFGSTSLVTTSAPTAATSTTTVTTTVMFEETVMVETVPQQEVLVEPPLGGVVDLTGGTDMVIVPPPVITPRPLAYTVGTTATSLAAPDELMTFDAAGNLTSFGDSTLGSTPTFDQSTATLRNAGTNQLSGLKWGRWSAGATQTVLGSTTSLDSSLHWIVGPLNEPVQVVTGTANYFLAGNTDPTDNTGQTGILGTASLSADFTNASVTSNVQLGIGNEVWNATGTGAITENLFQGQYTDVRVNGVVDGSGSFNGVFTNYSAGTPLGAGLVYQLTNGARTVNGAVILTQ